MPRYTTLVDTNAITNLTELRSVQSPNTLQQVGSMAFVGCVNLDQIDLPDSFEMINGLTFMNCRSLSKLDLPDFVYSIEESAFFRCENVDQIHISEEMALLLDGIFGVLTLNRLSFPKIFPKCAVRFLSVTVCERQNCRKVSDQYGKVLPDVRRWRQ